MRFLFLGLIVLMHISVSAQNKISSYDYWFDNNFEDVVHSSVIAEVRSENRLALSTESLKPGVHVLNMRFKDDAEVYSEVISTFFYKNVIGVNGNHLINGIEYWFDNNYENRVQVPITLINRSEYVSSLNVSGLNSGVHILNTRFYDKNGKYSVVENSFFMKPISFTNNDAKITTYKYWIDDNAGDAAIQDVFGQKNLVLTERIDLSTVTDGFHLITFQFCDASGKWSNPLGTVFCKKQADFSDSNKIVSYSFWFDDEDENIEIHIVDNVESGVFILEDIETESLSVGEHLLNVRFTDSKGKSSFVCTSGFERNDIILTIEEDQLLNNWKFYPNPIQELLRIELGDTYSLINVTVKDVNGRDVMNEQFRACNSIQLPFTVGSGVYFVSIKGESGRLIDFKVIKQ